MTRGIHKAGEKVFMLFDARARLGDTDDATVFETAQSEAEARRTPRGEYGEDAIWYEYTFNEKGEASNETPRYDIPT